MPQIGPLELILVLVIALLVLGPKRLPDAARSLGRGINEFRHGLTDHNRDQCGFKSKENEYSCDGTSQAAPG